MSYEGYYVYYCKGGHRIAEIEAYDDDEVLKCPVCGSTEIIFDSVDETNGCVCDELNEEDLAKGFTCPAHEKELQHVGWTPQACPECSGSGEVLMATDYRNEPCEFCGGSDGLCYECHGTGVTRVLEGEQRIHCSHCQGTGTTYVERFDISPLLR